MPWYRFTAQDGQSGREVDSEIHFDSDKDALKEYGDRIKAAGEAAKVGRPAHTPNRIRRIDVQEKTTDITPSDNIIDQ